MSEDRLSEEDLAMVRTLVPSECVGLLRMVDSMTAELRTLRVAMPTEGEREALEFAKRLLGNGETIFAFQSHDPVVAEHLASCKLALAALDKLTKEKP